ncbi:hypothetical protein [Leptospira haakeii]|uniref:DUF3601 domain-containing protein n=1 Tax=Leptospira haakeii TaxID=2023198 RepID=A0ABX4PM88_9LEPT|nr:hypothetical protein [Leptospira haakeii]PKA16892.1 hypothetical protein CH363_05715 [Leptospira haakeii]PKA19951.1 hypothetical protein CH377_08995 [Leptospira haakeii]
MSDNPFETGKKYRVLESFKFGSYDFQQGDILIYRSGGFSRYDDCYLFEFDDMSGNRKVCKLAPEFEGREIVPFFEEV